MSPSTPKRRTEKKRPPQLQALRDAISRGYDGLLDDPYFVGTGRIYLVPASGKEKFPYTVVHFVWGWACLGCKGFMYDTTDECRHIKRMKGKVNAAKEA